MASSKFSRRTRIQKTPPVCKAADRGPRILPISTSGLQTSFWWHGYGASGSPIDISSVRHLAPDPLNPGVYESTWNEGGFQITLTVWLFESDSIIAAFVLITRPLFIEGEAAYPDTEYLPRDPFDSGPLAFDIFEGSGQAGCRVTQ